MIPKYNEMYNAVLNVLKQHDEIRYRDLVEETADVLNISTEDRKEMLENNKATVLYYRLGWTRTYLAKAGLVEIVKRGIYKITEEGSSVLASGVNITNEYLMKYPSFVEFVKPNLSNNIEPNSAMEMMEEQSELGLTPNENIDKAVALINARLRSELLETISVKSPRFFENLVLDLLEKMGYAFDKESIIGTSYAGDEGIDGIIKEDRFGFNSIYVQAKRWQSGVGRPEIQKFLGAVAGQGGNKGLFITTSRFTHEAINYANKQLQVKLVLVDGEKLTDLMIKYGLGVSTVKTYELKQIDIDYFEEEM